MIRPSPERTGEGLGLTRLLAYLPRGNTLDDRAWRKRHVFLQLVLLLHLPALFLFGVLRGRTAWDTMVVLSVPAACLVLGRLIKHRRTASVLITAGLTYCSAVLVSFSGGSIEAHFHFFIMIGFIALYQDWVPFLWNVGFTVLSHGIGSAVKTNLIFNHPAGQTSPWVWSAIHGVAVLLACCGVVIFWETTEREQRKTLALTRQLADAELTRRRFTSDLLVNLARRNQSLLYRQLGLINQLEDQEEDPDALADLFRLDHLATRIRRNAESLLVLSGEEPPRTWGRPVALVDVVRAAIAETEDLDRVVFAVDERLAVFGNAVADLTHLLAELVENAVHFSPPEASVIIRTRPYLQTPGAHVLTVEDWGVGMRPEDMAAANELLATPVDVDLSVSQRLGLHVVARLAQRHGIQVSLTPTPGCGVTAAVVLSPPLFADPDAQPEPVFADDPDEVPAGVVPVLAASTRATPVADLPVGPPPPAPPAPSAPPGPGGPDWAPPPAERWIDLTDGEAPEPDGNGHGNGSSTPPGNGDADADATDWSGWWEPSPRDLPDGERLSPIAARPPLSERIQPPSERLHPPSMSRPDPQPAGRPDPQPSTGRPDPDLATGRPDPHPPMGTPHSHPPMGTPDPHPSMAGPPIREGSPIPEGVAPAVHSPHHPAPRAPETGDNGPYHPAPRGHEIGDNGLLHDHGLREHAPGPETGTDGPVLSRRVPQAHLAPELRRSGQGNAGQRTEQPVPDAAEARAALSRYQASRQAARAMVDEGEAEPGRPAGGGWA
jgi:signal transduction histidine kinase